MGGGGEVGGPPWLEIEVGVTELLARGCFAHCCGQYIESKIHLWIEKSLSNVCPTNPTGCCSNYFLVSPKFLILLAVQIALLTIYDMCKAVDRGMTMTDVKLLEKHGGKSGSFVAKA